MKNKNLILIQLNEINFDLIEKYIHKYNFPFLKKFLFQKKYLTTSEIKYNLLEPWIQWVSIYTGLSADEHKIFRLGDINADKDLNLIFEKIEDNNLTVGCISPMNAINKLKKPKYFISDPWINTKNDNSFWSKKIANLLTSIVNNNSSGKIGFNDGFYLILCLFKYTRIKNYYKLFYLLFNSYKKKWVRALLLDFLINEINLKYYKKHKPNFSSVFFNAGAHIQHHYLLLSEFIEKSHLADINSIYNIKSDPLLDMVRVYNWILQDYINKNYILATGLSQKPMQKLVYYYRLSHHKDFFKKCQINFENILPRMSRDFLVKFSSIVDAKNAELILKAAYEIKSKSLIFEEVDNRGHEIFVTLTYNQEIKEDTLIKINNLTIQLKKFVNFVAIKNAEHSSRGYLYKNFDTDKNFNLNNINVKEIYGLILNYFNIAK